MRGSKALIYTKVKIGKGAKLGLYVVIGEPPRSKKAGELATSIGEGAILRSHSVIYAGNRIGKNFQTGHHVLIREENEIGDDVSVGSGSVIEHHVKIGHGVRLHSKVFVPEYSVLEDGCWLGPGVILTNAKYPRSAGVTKSLKGPVIKKGAKIGAGAVILPAVVVGENALVGAGAVVTRNVPPGTVVAGNPARVLKTIKDLPY